MTLTGGLEDRNRVDFTDCRRFHVASEVRLKTPEPREAAGEAARRVR